MELTGTNRQPGGFIGYIGEADATGVLKSNVSYSTGNAGYKFDGSTETIKYTTAQIENLYSLRESRLKRESSRTGNTNLTQITDVTVDKLSQKEFYTNMGWSEDVWDFAPLKEGKTPILRNNDSNMTTMLQTKEIASAADLKNIKNDLSGVYVLTTDIDISESASGTAVIPGIFKGTLKGNGHQIIGQKIPLFDTLDGATIENVKLVQGEINQKGTDKVAALAKTSQADTLIKDVYVRDMSVTGQSNVAGLVASMNKTTVEECSVNATVNGKRAGGFAAEILGDSVVKNSYARRTADKETFAATEGDLQGGFAAVIKKSELINNFSELTLSQKAEEKPEETPKKSSEKAAKTACMVGNFVAESGVGSEAVTKAEHNISFGPKEYSFAGNSTAENVLTNYTENYEYTGSVSNDEGTQTPEHTGKIDKATAAQITNKTFYIDTLKWDEKIWYLDDVAGGKRPRLKAEGDVYGAEEEDTSKGENKYTKYVLKNDIDASSVTTETAVVKGIFKGEFDGGGFTIKGLKKPLFEKVQEGTVRNLKIENAEINSTEESSKNAVITKESNHAVFESLNLADIKVSGVSYNAVVTGYDYTSSVFSKIQIRNAQITGTKNYNAVLAGRASGSQIQDVSVIGSSVALSGTDCGGFIGEGKNVTISRVYSDADMTVNTYTDDKNRTQSAGFIGNLTGKSSVEYVFAAGKVDNKTSEQLYNFIGTPDALKTMVKNSFVIQNAGGVSNITDGVGQEILREVTSQEAATSDFYKTSMTLNEETWNLSLVPMKGYPELKGMEKREVISVKTAEDFMKMKDFPTQEYRLKADIDLSGTEQTGSVIPEFSGVLDGENHKITGLKAPLFGQLSGTVSNVAIDAGAIEIGNSVDTTVGIFANTMTS